VQISEGADRSYSFREAIGRDALLKLHCPVRCRLHTIWALDAVAHDLGTHSEIRDLSHALLLPE